MTLLKLFPASQIDQDYLEFARFARGSLGWEFALAQYLDIVEICVQADLVLARGDVLSQSCRRDSAKVLAAHSDNFLRICSCHHCF